MPREPKEGLGVRAAPTTPRQPLRNNASNRPIPFVRGTWRACPSACVRVPQCVPQCVRAGHSACARACVRERLWGDAHFKRVLRQDAVVRCRTFFRAFLAFEAYEPLAPIPAASVSNSKLRRLYEKESATPPLFAHGDRCRAVLRRAVVRTGVCQSCSIGTALDCGWIGLAQLT